MDLNVELLHAKATAKKKELEEEIKPIKEKLEGMEVNQFDLAHGYTQKYQKHLLREKFNFKSRAIDILRKYLAGTLHLENHEALLLRQTEIVAAQKKFAEELAETQKSLEESYQLKALLDT